jgi:hypothetical protein
MNDKQANSGIKTSHQVNLFEKNLSSTAAPIIGISKHSQIDIISTF